jgi:MoxR-like ATPase
VNVNDVKALAERMRAEIGKAVVGQADTVELMLTALMAGGHVLLEGPPGTAKTFLAQCFARTLGLQYGRIQFTPDLMPGDIIGSNLFNFQTSTFTLTRGPIFTDLLLADEINRTPPKTQAALLEAMQERKVTIGGQTRLLPDPFLVVATQNPIEQEGTYPLPEAQLDRFMFSLHLDYPDKNEEIEIVKRTTLREMPTLKPTVSGDDLLRVQRLVLAAPVSDHVIDYAVSLAAATRPTDSSAPQMVQDYVEWGAGPRASQYLVLGAKALALLDGRITPETADVREVAMHVLQHRVITNYRATGAGKKSRDIVESILTNVPEKSY